MRLKENVKTIILILLIMSSCLLALKIWAFDSGMISSSSYLYRLSEWVKVGVKYGFNSSQYVYTGKEQEFKSSVFDPNHIIINKDQKHYFSYFDVKRMETINQDIKDIIKNAVSDSQKTWSDTYDKEYINTITNDSILIKYSSEFSYDIFSEYIGVLQNQFGQEISFDTILIYSDIKNNKLNIYFKSTKNQSIKKLQTELSQKNSAIYLKTLEQKEAFSLCTFGFEDKTKRNVSVGDFVIFLKDNIVTNDIEQVNVLSEKENSDMSQVLSEKLLRTFDFSTLIKHYDDGQGNKVFVENNSTIIIYKDGFIEYFVSNPQRGLKIDSSGDARNFSKIKVLNISTNLFSKIGSSIIGDSVATVRFAGMEQNQQDKSIRVYYDYIIDGIPFNCKNGGIKGYPITIDVNESGQISYVKIYANTFKYTNSKINNLSYDNVFEILEVNNIQNIESLDLCYEKSLYSNKIVSKWNFES